MTPATGDGEPAKSIADVLSRLEAIKTDASKKRSKLGYFAAVYLRITQTVKRKLEEGGFHDAAWVEHVDVTFASRYFEALDQFQAGRIDSRAWRLALDAVSMRRPVILQHILLGINAHINYDLGIATAECGQLTTSDHERDFNTVNDCAAAEVSSLQKRLGRLSPFINLFDELNGRAADGTVVNFGIDRAREQAWQTAQLLTYLPKDEHAAQLRVIDRDTTALGRLILNPPGLLAQLGLRAVRLGEMTSPVRSVINRL